MKLMQLCVGMVRTNCYIVYDETTREAAVIDPGDNAGSILNAVHEEKLNVKYVLLTHAHFDHILAAHEVLEATGAQYVVPEKDTWLLNRDNMGQFRGLARGMIERGMTRGEAAAELRDHFHVSPERTALTIRAAATAMEMDKTIGENDISLYVGIPFCPSRCYYCSFVSATTAQSAGLIEPYLDTLCREIKETAALVREAGKRVQSVYIGGGTPTTLDEHQLARLLSALENSFDFSQLREYTVEAGRPDTITPEKLRVLKSAGVGRVSINPQSMNDAVLAAIGRRHGAADVLRAFDEARQAGFDEINMDLIAGLTGDTAETFAQTVDTLLGLSPENITVHTLAIKRGADLTDKAAASARRDTVFKMLDGASHALQNAGYGPYYLYRQKFTAGGFENVGWCRPDTECFYNVSMMEELQTILSLGAGGVSKRVVRETGWIERANNPKYPLEYIQAADRLANGKKKLLFPKK